MKIAQLRIQNILGIDNLEFTAGHFNRITGDNGVGKTSVQEAIKSALKGGHDATLLRKGEEVGEVVIIFDTGETLRKTVTATKSQLVVEGTTRPAEYLDRVRNLTSVNPSSFLFCDDKQRLELLLEAVPFEFDWDRLSEIVGSPIPNRKKPLDVIESWRKSIFDDRTVTNRFLKEKEASLKNLRRSAVSLPDNPPTETIESLEKQITTVATDREGSIETLRKSSRQQTDTLKTALDEKINTLRAEYDNEVGQITINYERELSEIMSSASATLEPLQTHLAEAREQLRTFDMAKSYNDEILKLENDIEHLTGEAKSNSDNLDEIVSMKANILKKIPIEGVDVIDGVIFVDGHEWQRVNESKRTIIANEIAKLLAKDLRLICWDGMEVLSKDSMQKLEESTQNDGYQYWVSYVSEGALSVFSEADNLATA